jgi:hypothetical protein
MWEGTCEKFADVDQHMLADWISAIPFSEWPQQNKVDEQLRPAMISDLNWHGFGAVAYSVDSQLAPHLQQYKVSNRMLSVVMPGHDIRRHQDLLGPAWITRIHVPLVTNPAARFIIGDMEYTMKTGGAYKVDIAREHAVYNHGCVPRIHFMFDCYV